MKTNIIPEPQHTEIKSESAVFTLTRLAEISADGKSERALRSFCAFCEKAFELSFLGTGKESVTLCVNNSVTEKEGYRLTVRENSVLVEGADERGVFWGVQSLCALLFQNDCNLCALTIYDYPKTENRAFMLDCASWFFTPEAVKLFLDAMALNKLNVFHWKLSGDCGFRLELFENYLLSQIGGFRAYTGLGKIPHGGYYSREDTLEILKYAEERFITVIPEIDVPDKVTAAVAAYPFLSCDEKEVSPATSFADTETVLCLGKESTYSFMLSVLEEMREVFPGSYIHLGGERSKKRERSLCPHCEEKRLSLPEQSEDALYSFFFERLLQDTQRLGLKAIVRADGFSLPQGIIADCRTEQEAKTAEEKGLSFLDSSLDLSKPYGVLGVEDCYEHGFKKEKPLFSEAVLPTMNVPDMKKAGVLLFPRLGAFSESVWTNDEEKSFPRFLEKLEDYRRALRFLPFDCAKKSTAFPGAAKKLGGRLRNRLLHTRFTKNS